jgi:hypothetical protein
VVPPAPAPPRTLIDLAPGVRVDRRRGVVEVYAVVCIETGLLEQIACAPQTREHEALVSVRARPRDVHAGLLLLGLAPGRPGWWKLEGDRLMEQAPTGAAISVAVRWRDPQGVERSEPIERWVRDAATGAELSPASWVFAGSVLEPRQPARQREGAPPDELGQGTDRYLADDSGSVVGLVTFGDEVVAFSLVLPDSEDVRPLEWEAWTERLPPVGTPVVLILGRVDASTAGADVERR